MKHKAVIGLGFGDEGKGITTDYLCSLAPNQLVVRYSGGHQAGHTVVIGRFIRHVFSNFGSGSLRGMDTYWSKFCTVEPVGLIKEYYVLSNLGEKPTIYIDENSPVTTPYDIEANIILEKQNNHGSCMVGFGTTIEREERLYSLRFIDLYHPSVLNEKLKAIKRYYSALYNPDRLSGSMTWFLMKIELLKEMKNIRTSNGLPNKKYTNIIFEGSQGLLLDQNFGFFPHVTRTNTGTKNIFSILKKKHQLELYLVTRAYHTRHGNGFMPNEDISHKIKVNDKETNIKNQQGEFRRAVLDADMLRYSINKDEEIRKAKNKTLVITCMDHLDEYTLTMDGEFISCDREIDFINRLSVHLGIQRIIISKSDQSDNFKVYC